MKKLSFPTVKLGNFICEVKEKEGYKIKLIEAKTFEGVLADLSKL